MKHDMLSLILSRIVPGEKGPIWPELYDIPSGLVHIVAGISRNQIFYYLKGYDPMTIRVKAEFYMNDYRIIAKSFEDLCREVEADPRNNAAVRAFCRGGHVGGEIDPAYVSLVSSRVVDGDIVILRQWVGDEKPTEVMTLFENWGIIDNECGYSFPCHFTQSLIREGYAIGLPEGTFITPKELI